MKSRASERGVTSWSLPLTVRGSELLLLSSAHQLGQRDSDHERAAVEHLLDERTEAQKDEACEPSDQEIDGDRGAPRIETPGRNARRSKERGGESRQLIGDAGHRVRRALSGGIEDAGQSAEEP